MKDKEVQISLSGALAQDGDKFVKGFMSMNSIDLDNDLAAPEAFDLKTFLQKGTLLYNHKLWKDDNGNPITVGRVLDADVVKLVDPTDDHDPSLWLVRRVSDGEIFDSFPKERMPNAVSGDRGVFIKARIDVPEVWRRVLRKMLEGFSWVGNARYGVTNIGGKLRNFIKSVAMQEVSVVFSPQHPNAMLVPVMKSSVIDTIDGIGDVVYCLVFSPSVFDDVSASLWLKKRGFQFEDNLLKSEDGDLVFPQISNQLIVEDTARSIKIAQGVQAVVGMLEEKILENEKTETLELTRRILGCSVISSDRVSQVEQVKQEDIVLKKSLDKPVSESTVQPDPVEGADGTIGAPIVEAKTSNEAAPETTDEVVKQEAAATEVVADAAVEGAANKPEVVEETTDGAAVEPVVAASKSTDVKTEEVVAKVDSEAASKLTTVDDVKIEKALKDPAFLQEISSKMSQNVVTSINASVGQMVEGLEGTLGKFTEVATKLSDMLAAQSEAIASQLTPAPVPAMAKSDVSETVSDESQSSVEGMKETIKGLQMQLETLQKTAVTNTIPDEPKHRSENKVSNSVADEVLPDRFLGLPRGV